MKKNNLLILFLLIFYRLASQSDCNVIIKNSDRQTIEAVILYTYSKSENTITTQLLIKNQFYTFYDNSFINCVIISKNDTLKHLYPNYEKWCFSFYKRDRNLMIADSMYYYQTLNNSGYIDYFSDCFYKKDNDTNHIYISFKIKMIAINYYTIKGERFLVLDKPIDYKSLTKKQESKYKLNKLDILYVRQFMSE